LGLASEYADATWRVLQEESLEDLVIATGETCTSEMRAGKFDWSHYRGLPAYLV